MTLPNYDKFPYIEIEKVNKSCITQWDNIAKELKKKIRSNGRTILVIECYPGVDETGIFDALQQLKPALILQAQSAYKDEADIREMVSGDVTDDRVFGYLSRLNITDYFDEERVGQLKGIVEMLREGLVLIVGTGASYIAAGDLLVYADLARWEIQLRMRRNEVYNLGMSNSSDSFAALYKHAFFVDWRVADKWKKQQMRKWDYLLDTHVASEPKLVPGAVILEALRKCVTRPFRVVPFFDPGPWGGQWLKKVVGLDEGVVNYAWGFDCVPEENSLLLSFGDIKVEIPSINLVFHQPAPLLGSRVYARFGDEFPIRFDFLDTMDGGNLSLQVHPLTQYIQEKFGMHYTQDESYYMLDAGEGAVVYLGLADGVDPAAMIEDLKAARDRGETFEAERHVAKWPVKKHDHFSIPAGTVHCSGANSVVLEISATPYIFTFKLWDWNRLGLDGKPRPINIEHGEKNIQWERTASWIKKYNLDLTAPISAEEGIREERTGLHETEFIETRRHWFNRTVHHNTNGGVNVLNLVEGREIIVESPTGTFEPFVVHYAETFIVPAAVGEYTVRPHGESAGQECATIKAYVR